MNGLLLYLPPSAKPELVADRVRHLGLTHGPRPDGSIAIGVDEGTTIYIDLLAEHEVDSGTWPTVVTRLFDEFCCFLVQSHDFRAITSAVRAILDVWRPAIVDDDGGHLFDGDVFASWLDANPAATWADVYEGALWEIPQLG